MPLLDDDEELLGRLLELDDDEETLLELLDVDEELLLELEGTLLDELDEDGVPLELEGEVELLLGGGVADEELEGGQGVPLVLLEELLLLDDW